MKPEKSSPSSQEDSHISADTAIVSSDGKDMGPDSFVDIYRALGKELQLHSKKYEESWKKVNIYQIIGLKPGPLAEATFHALVELFVDATGLEYRIESYVDDEFTIIFDCEYVRVSDIENVPDYEEFLDIYVEPEMKSPISKCAPEETKMRRVALSGAKVAKRKSDYSPPLPNEKKNKS